MMNLCSSIIAQTCHIDGIINKYAKVTNIIDSTVTLSINASSMFSKSDTVLLIQMTGIAETGNEVKDAGRYEFHIVTKVNGQTVSLRAPPGSFDMTELVQLIRVPSYKNAEITKDGLTCQPWKWADGTGGVLALMVEGTLTFNGSIDVSECGFKGGDPSGKYTGMCSFDPPYKQSNYTANNDDRAGNKGEGAVTTSYFNPGAFSANVRGYGKTYNGGGGGNGQWSGGGGGGNGGYGGRGGDQLCGQPGSDSVFLSLRYLHNEGYAFKYDEPFWITPSKHAFMGGGGGAGTGVGTAGGNGGGIVIIVAHKFQFSENTAAIKSNGGSVGGAPSEAGAGGGGAGGSVLLLVEDYGNMKVEIEGGKGGNVRRDNNTHSQGSGGGGGGGFLFTSKAVNLANIKRTGGDAGTWINDWGKAGKGEDGFYQSNFQVQLRGFFRNFIITPDTTVCYGDDYNKSVTIRASQPLGGDGYRWEKSLNGITDWEKIENDNLYQLTTKFTQDIFVRRVVISTSENIIDEGLPVKINVYKPVTNEIAPKKATLCWEKSFVIEGSVPTGGGGANEGDYSYQWQEFINDDWKDIKNETSKNLTAPFPSIDDIMTYQYRRIITSIPAGCISNVETAEITVQPVIKDNTIIPESQEVCDTVEQLIGGDGINLNYTFQWQISTDRQNWKELTDKEAKLQNYTPLLNTPQILPSEYYQVRYYRRIVSSDECESASKDVMVHFYQHPSKARILTEKNDSLNFLFTKKLEAEQPVVGNGRWWSTMNELNFDRCNEWITNVSNLQIGNNIIFWEVETSDNVCPFSRDTITLKVLDIIIPTGFSPNGDKINDCFRIAGAENAISSELIVFDRYNNIVYESKSYTGSSDLDNCEGWWNGSHYSSGKELPSGVYYYQLTINGGKPRKGYVVLKR